jgi:hypothetical protein
MSTIAPRITRSDVGTVSVDLWVTDCPSCFVVFAMPKALEAARRDDAGKFYCPNGHSMSFHESALDRERKRAQALEREKARLEEDRSWYQERLREERKEHKTTTARLNGTKGALKKAQKRAAASLCPVDGCKRKFVQMERHLAAKHPDYAPVEEA